MTSGGLNASDPERYPSMRNLLLLALAPALAVWYGFVLSIMWGWFVVPTFHVAPLRIPFAIGIGYIVQFLAHQTPKEEPETWHVLRMGIMKPAVLLFAGWIVTWFI